MEKAIILISMFAIGFGVGSYWMVNRCKSIFAEVLEEIEDEIQKEKQNEKI